MLKGCIEYSMTVRAIDLIQQAAATFVSRKYICMHMKLSMPSVQSSCACCLHGGLNPIGLAQAFARRVKTMLTTFPYPRRCLFFKGLDKQNETKE